MTNMNMRHFISIMEKWDKTVRRVKSPENFYPFEVEVYRNPSRLEFGKLIRNYGMLRAFIEKTGDLIVFKGTKYHTLFMGYFTHIGVVIRRGDTPYIFEANSPTEMTLKES